MEPSNSAAQPSRSSGVTSPLAVGTVALGAALVMISGFMVWFVIFGVDLTGFRMANLVSDYADVIDEVPPKFLGYLWYLLPLLGALTWLLLFVRAPISVRPAHVVLGMIIVITVGVFLGVAARRSEVTAGPVLAFVGGILVVIGAWSGLARQNVGPQA